MSSRTIAIGDIHGCSAALRAVLTAIRPATDDTLILLGDYVDRGPNSREVIEIVLELEKQCRLVSLIGNHELMLLDSVEISRAVGPWLECGGAATLRSYGSLQEIPREHMDFVRRCRRYYEIETHFFVHANYAADVPLDEQPDYLLFWEHLHSHVPEPHENGKVAIVGHTSQKTGEVCDLVHVICIDTYCHGGGWLTALDVNSGHIWQADRHGRLRKG
jgi:serine/threonine protein phosphatase 1